MATTRGAAAAARLRASSSSSLLKIKGAGDGRGSSKRKPVKEGGEGSPSAAKKAKPAVLGSTHVQILVGGDSNVGKGTIIQEFRKSAWGQQAGNFRLRPFSSYVKDITVSNYYLRS